MELRHSHEDELVVAAQLARPVRGEWAVACRCHLGVPMVIENHPRLPDGSPFPTLFWLTCPLLNGRVGTLEAGGRMARLTERLQQDQKLHSRLADAMARYQERRDGHEQIDDGGAPPGGGPDRVKCLHAHVAHQLADGPNPAGAWALSETGWPDCQIPCFKVSDD
jgi:uncharacterized protein